MKKTNKYPLLSKINDPSDLRRMPEEEMEPLCEEIRAFLIENVSRTGGHLASNLGVVELSVALHRVFDIPSDHLIFDVGHQCYIHKLLTGRRAEFDTLRTPGGLSGFTKREESEYDAFGAGHSSTSLSAALGFACADKIEGKNNYTVAVIGDGAYTGGMIHEALNNVSRSLRLLVVLNENEMSISKNTGAFARYMAKIRTSRRYRRTKSLATRFLHKLPLFGRPLYLLISRVKRFIKRIFYTANYFEHLGLYYLGPADGNDYKKVAFLLRQAKEENCSVLLHLRTKKGKGYPPAEENPCEYHSVYNKKRSGTTFSETMGNALCKMAEEDPDVTVVSAAMREGCGLSRFFERFSQRAFDVGIAEEHALTFSAGLAAAGKKPYIALYSTFLQRGYDNLLHDIALQKLPVRLLVDRAGLSGGDGPTHHGIFDVAFLSHIPHFRILAPATLGSLSAMMRDSLSFSLPTAIRYENRGENEAVVKAFYPNGDYEGYGVRADFSDSAACRDGVIVTYGAITSIALSAEAKLREKGRAVGTVLLEELKPYEKTAKRLLSFVDKETPILFLEEGIYDGGAGMLLCDRLRALGHNGIRTVLAIRDHFASPPMPADLYSYCEISEEDVIRSFEKQEKTGI